MQFNNKKTTQLKNWQKILIDNSPKKTANRQHEKMFNITKLEKYKSKPQ